MRSSRVPRAWLTRFERSGQRQTADHRESMQYFARLAEASPRARLVPYGVSPEGRSLAYLAVGARTPAQAHRSGRAVVLIQGCIHGGEVDGKEAAMLLVREMLISRRLEHLLERVVLLVAPIVNPDGHDRLERSHRPNQNGPEAAGWRTTAQDVNMNRDYAKGDAPEMRALQRVYAAWRPHVIVDTHTTNGADYRYHVCFSIERAPNLDAGLADWAAERLLPAVEERVEAEGYQSGPYIDAAGGAIESIRLEPSLPRYSTGYAAAIDRIGLLVETHALKPFGERVEATRLTCEAVLECAGRHADELSAATRAAEERSLSAFAGERRPVPLSIGLTDEARPFLFRGYETVEQVSVITAAPVVRYTGEPCDSVVPLFDTPQVEVEAVLPAAYVLPPALSHLAERLGAHGLGTEVLGTDTTCLVERSRLLEVSLSAASFEGRQTMSCRAERFPEKLRLRAGAVVVPCAQPRVRLLAHLLEPESPDSFAGWGFFNAFLERKEYAEDYLMEPVARAMLEGDPELAEEFAARLEADEAFREDPGARLDFFYRRSGSGDPALCVDPVVRIPDGKTLSRLRKLVVPVTRASR